MDSDPVAREKRVWSLPRICLGLLAGTLISGFVVFSLICFAGIVRRCARTSTPLGELCYAAERGDVAAINTLLKTRPNLLNQEFHGTTTPLQFAVFFQKSEAVSVLLNYGANPNIADNRGQTPLHVAASRGYKDIVQMLLDHKASMNVCDQRGMTALDLALQFGQSGIVSLLRSNAVGTGVSSPHCTSPKSSSDNGQN
jgi:hypothetical protein